MASPICFGEKAGKSMRFNCGVDKSCPRGVAIDRAWYGCQFDEVKQCPFGSLRKHACISHSTYADGNMARGMKRPAYPLEEVPVDVVPADEINDTFLYNCTGVFSSTTNVANACHGDRLMLTNAKKKKKKTSYRPLLVAGLFPFPMNGSPRPPTYSIRRSPSVFRAKWSTLEAGMTGGKHDGITREPLTTPSSGWVHRQAP